MRYKARTFVIALSIVIFGAITRGHAQAVYCANCGTEVTQFLNYLQLIDQLTKQAALLQNGVTQTNTMRVNTTPLTSFQWGNGAADLNALIALLNQSPYGANVPRSIDYNTALNSRFDQTALAAKYQQWSTDTNSSVAAAVKANQLQSAQMTGAEEAHLQTLQAQMQAAQGQLQAIQVSSAISVEEIRQLQKLRQSILTLTQLMATNIQQAQDKETTYLATRKTFFTAPQTTSVQGTQY